jgi:hypothetical protein
MKPNMDHLNVYPNFYINNQTYVSHDWDFINFNQRLDDILTHPGRYEEIAREGQRVFKQSMNDGVSFAKHFRQMIS